MGPHLTGARRERTIRRGGSHDHQCGNGDERARDRRRHLLHQHPALRGAGRILVQPVPRRRRGAFPLSHRPASAAREDAGGRLVARAGSQAFVKRLPGESIATPFRQSGHSASGHDGTDSDRSERAGTEKALAGRPRSTIEPTARTRPPEASTAADASRVDLPVVNTSSTTTTGSPRSSAKPPSLRSTDIAGTRRARAVSWPMITPPSAGETTAFAEKERSLCASSWPARSARSGNISSRAHWR